MGGTEVKHIIDEFSILYADDRAELLSDMIMPEHTTFSDTPCDDLMILVCSEGCVKFSSVLYSDFGEISFDNLDWLIETLQKIKEKHVCKGGKADE